MVLGILYEWTYAIYLANFSRSLYTRTWELYLTVYYNLNFHQNTYKAAVKANRVLACGKRLE